MNRCETCEYWNKIDVCEYEEGACRAPLRDIMRSKTGVDREDRFRIAPILKARLFTGKNFCCIQYKRKITISGGK